MEFYLVDVKNIAPARALTAAEELRAEALAESILECGGLVEPLILKQTGPEEFSVVSGIVKYHAAVKAREIDPRNCEMVNAFVITRDAEQAVSRQLNVLWG